MADKNLNTISLTDVGETYEESEICCCPPNKKEKYYPCLYLGSEQLPSLDKCEVGDEILIVAKAKIKSKSTREDEDETISNFDIEIKEMGITKKQDTNKKELAKEMAKY